MGKKKANGEGSVYKRLDGLWCGQVSLADGKRKTVYAKTRIEASRKIAALLATVERGLPIVQERVTVGHYLAQWLETIRPTVKPRTWLRYEVVIRAHLTPTLGKTRLARLTPQQVQALYAEKLTAGLSAGTVAHLHAVLHKALDAALRLDLVVRNVADRVTPPRAIPREMQVLTPEQAQTLLATAHTHQDRLEALYVLAIHTGMRLGELLALRWEDVDLTTGALQVRHTLHHMKGGAWRLGTPKTAKGRRRIDLGQACLDALRTHRARQAGERLRMGDAWNDHGFVYTRADGEPLRGTHVQQRNFVALLKRAGLPIIRFHDLRHTAATILLVNNVNPKVVSELLGHSDVGITLGLYSHVLPSMQRARATVMDRLLGS